MVVENTTAAAAAATPPSAPTPRSSGGNNSATEAAGTSNDDCSNSNNWPDTTTTTAAMSSSNSILSALTLAGGGVSASVTDVDHHRTHGGLAVETEYIVQVKPAFNNSSHSMVVPIVFDAFLLSKSYSEFRCLATALYEAAEQEKKNTSHKKKSYHSSNPAFKAAVHQAIKLCELCHHLVESQPTQYLGKVNYLYVQMLSKQRKQIINEVLDLICQSMPQIYSKLDKTSNNNSWTEDGFLRTVAELVETFFLTDHVEESPAPSPPSHVRSASLPSPATTTTAATTATTTTTKKKDTMINTDVILDTLNPLHWAETLSTGITGIKNPFAAAITKTREATSSTNNDDKAAAAVATPTMAATAATSEEEEDAVLLPKRRTSHVTPLTKKVRRTITERMLEEETLTSVGGGNEAALLLMDEKETTTTSTATTNPLVRRAQRRSLVPSYARPIPTVQSAPGSLLGNWIDNNPIAFSVIFVLAVLFLQAASNVAVKMDGDLCLLLIFASFCLGLHTPRPAVQGIDHPHALRGTIQYPVKGKKQQRHPMGAGDASGRKLLRRSMMKEATTVQQVSQQVVDQQNAAGRSSVVARQANEAAQQVVQSIRDTDPATAAAAAAAATADYSYVDEETLSLVDEDSSSVATQSQQAGAATTMAKFPEGAAIGSHLNCWSLPKHDDFKVRGPKYLSDKKKIASSQFLFPCRGIDLFLTDTCPENVAANPSLLGGKVRDVATFIINFRLPWGILVLYFEIPDKFIPYVKAGYENNRAAAGDNDGDKEKLQQLIQDLDHMTPPERCVCRYLMKDDSHKNQNLKIVPIVVDGPWVVRQVVGGKPAIIGNKLPITYVYQPEQVERTSHGTEIVKALYLEADLDIAASSAARGILSVVRTYTQVLTLDLGFVVQGNTEDELPEQMLVGCRLHGVDPLTAPHLPTLLSPSSVVMNNLLHNNNNNTSGSSSLTPGSYYKDDEDESLTAH